MNDTGIEVLRSKRWLFYLIGGGLILLGVAAILLLYLGAVLLQVSIGIIFLIGGLIFAVHYFSSRREEGWLGSGMVSLAFFLAGLALLIWPRAGLNIVLLVLGILFPLEGLFELYQSWKLRGYWSWGWGIVSGLVSLALGVIVWINWGSLTSWLIGVIVGIDFIVSGMVILLFAGQMGGVREAGGRRLAGGTA
jgi:uncharacterized membrane protein HdeD (DUF308 family)